MWEISIKRYLKITHIFSSAICHLIFKKVLFIHLFLSFPGGLDDKDSAFGDFPGSSDGKESACSAGELSSIPGSGRSPGEGNGNPLQYSCLENPMDRGIWWVTVHGVPESWTWLSDWYLFLAVLGLCCRTGFSLVAASRFFSSWRCASFSLQLLLSLWTQALGLTGFISCGART